MKVQAVIVAAGSGQRLGLGVPKALAEVAGAPLLVHTLRRFEAAGMLEEAVITYPAEALAQFETTLQNAFPEAVLHLVAGGAERQESVARALAALNAETEIVAVHDAARPLVSPDIILESVRAAESHGAATVATPSVDTILQGDDDGFLVDTPERRYLWACQTPQVFRVDLLREAHALAREQGQVVTDDATLVRRSGHSVKLVSGAPTNIKVTTPFDLDLCGKLLASEI